MTQRIFTWTKVIHGWASFELASEGVAAYRTTVGDSTDVFRVLLVSILGVLNGEERQECSFDNEPGEIRLVLESSQPLLNIRIERHDEWGKGAGKVQWSARNIDARAFAADVLMSTVDLMEKAGVKHFQELWPAYPYPQAEVDQVKRVLAVS
ncbi:MULTISPECIES: hypothetical protein [Frankia]|uniref:hypothetical protein n=1 Tax=Frankia TaxID=1854 RepID=UPI0005D0FB6B|nr:MULTISPECIES: hypothetical protein [Frankia]